MRVPDLEEAIDLLRTRIFDGPDVANWSDDQLTEVLESSLEEMWETIRLGKSRHWTSPLTLTVGSLSVGANDASVRYWDHPEWVGPIQRVRLQSSGGFVTIPPLFDNEQNQSSRPYWFYGRDGVVYFVLGAMADSAKLVVEHFRRWPSQWHGVLDANGTTTTFDIPAATLAGSVEPDSGWYEEFRFRVAGNTVRCTAYDGSTVTFEPTLGSAPLIGAKVATIPPIETQHRNYWLLDATMTLFEREGNEAYVGANWRRYDRLMARFKDGVRSRQQSRPHTLFTDNKMAR